MREPNIPLLIQCAKRLARSVGVPSAPDKDVRRVIDDILYGRQILAAGRQGLITREETGYVLVGHWLSELFMRGTFKGDDPVFVREVAAAILGPPRTTPKVKVPRSPGDPRKRSAPRTGAFAALLRAVNVGGTGKLPMAALTKLCADAGFSCVRTYIASGNVVFATELVEAKVHAKLDKALTKTLGKSVGVLLRTRAELEAIIAKNPFKNAPANRVIVYLLPNAPPATAIAQLKIPGKEEVKLIGREIFVHYPTGQGTSKLKVPFSDVGTGRNLNTVAKLAAMLSEIA